MTQARGTRPKRTTLPPEAPKPCLYCKQPILLRLQAPGFRSRWARDNPDGTRHDCPVLAKRPRYKLLRERQARYNAF